MVIWLNPFNTSWWNSPLRLAPAVVLLIVGAICLFGCPRWIPALLDVNQALMKDFAHILWVIGSAGIVFIILAFVILHSVALNSGLYAKYCATSVLLYVFYTVGISGSVHIYGTLFSYFIPFDTTVLLTAFEILPILLHLCSYATLRPCGNVLSTIAMIGYTTKLYGLALTSLFSAVCGMFRLSRGASAIFLLASRILAICIAILSYLQSVPPLKRLVAVHAQYPPNDVEEGSQFVDESVHGHRVPLMRKEVVSVPPVSSNQSHTLCIVQLTDIHIGTVTTPDNIRDFCSEIVSEIKPDFVFLTGDMLTTPYLTVADEVLRYALEPLKQMPGRVFGCLGNHDQESEDVISNALISSGVNLLMDEAVEVNIDKCDRPIQIIGFNYRKPFPVNAGFYRSILEQNPPHSDDTLRLVLLHDPTSFKFIPLNTRCFVFSGHTHGGIIGIPQRGSVLSLGGFADNGLWQRGKNLNYIHCGQGSRFMLGTNVGHLGITCEKSVMVLHY